MSQTGRLCGKCVMVTGGGNGIGKAICKLFAKEGASVAILDIDSKGIKETLSQMDVSNCLKHCEIETDISSSEQVKQAFEKAQEALGKKCTVLINNAGITGKGIPLDKISEEDFDAVSGVNLKGTFLMTKEFITLLKESEDESRSERGIIVNMSSIGGKCGFFYNGEYSSTKAGILGLTKTLAQEYPLHRVRCNAVLPGIIDTTMVRNANQQIVQMFLKQVPMERLGTPEEVAKVCLFLASDESSFMNGACLEVSGGFGL